MKHMSDTVDTVNEDTYEDLNNTEEKKEEEFKSVEQLTQHLYDCYQIQVDDEGNCQPVLLGRYHEIPLPINKVIKYKKYLLHVVTYILTQEEVDNKLYKIVGVNVIRQNRKNSICSLDLTFNVDQNRYELLFCDHKKDPNDPTAVQLVEVLPKFPGKDKVMQYIINKAFDDPVKSVLTSK